MTPKKLDPFEELRQQIERKEEMDYDFIIKMKPSELLVILDEIKSLNVRLSDLEDVVHDYDD